jgi:hypothetical protein
MRSSRVLSLVTGLSLIVGLAVAPLAVEASSASAAAVPGTTQGHAVKTHATTTSGLTPFTSVTGKVYMSLTGLGTTKESGPIYVQKDSAHSTVQSAYLLAASAPEETIGNTQISVNGTPLSFPATHSVVGSFGVNNVWTNVTSLVAPVVDAATPGLVKFTVAEGANTDEITGEILAVVMADPTLPTVNTVSFLFGALNTTGTSFKIGLANPLNLKPTVSLNMSIGDSFGFQGPPGTGQYSTISVDTKLMTSAAGGNDDSTCKYKTPHTWGSCGNGSLLTVGGIGDNTTDPANPTATTANCATPPGPPRCTDELYTLLPFVQAGQTSITVKTDNPSNNDNIFFSGFQLNGVVGAIGQGVLLTPVTGKSPVGTPYTFTAKVQNATSEPVAGAKVTFTVESGPNAGKKSTATTNTSGNATFTDTSTTTGTDSVEATTVTTKGTTLISNAATVTWTSTLTSSVTGYWEVGGDGGVFSFGSAQFYGSMGNKTINAPVVGMASLPTGKGYWLVAKDGGVFAFGSAPFYGSLGGKTLNAPITGMAAMPTGKGYWLVASDGGVFAFGSAQFHGSMGGKSLDAPIVGIAATADGNGYWLVGADGGVFALGDAQYHGSMGGKPLNAAMVGIAGTPDRAGYWLDAADGGVFSFGDANFHGSMGGKPLNAPMVGMAPTASGLGYWLDAADGGVFAFGNANYFGSMGGKHLNAPMVGMALAG